MKKINTTYRFECLTLGLETPLEHSINCGCKQLEAPTLVELDLASRKHRFHEMRKLEVDFFNGMMDLVTWYEDEALNIFNLPKIEVVRAAMLTGEDQYPGKVEITREQAAKYRDMLSRWQLELIGDKKILKSDDSEDVQSAVYNYNMFGAYAIGLDRTKKMALKNLPQDIAQFVDRINIPPDWNNKYLQAAIKDGTKRVKTKLAQDYRDGVLSWLRIMAREGHNPLYIARWLHNEYEGKAWYWNRLARSESALALNAGYDSWSNEANVLYDEWSAAGDACLICAAFNGQVWKRGEGPEPVSATHPHCRCIRVPKWITEGKRVNPEWTRPSPYDVPYNIDRENNIIPELENMFG